MGKAKIFIEIFGKSILFMVIAVVAFVTLSLTLELFKLEGITFKSITLALITASVWTLIITPDLPTNYHNLICKPAERKPEDTEG